MGEPGPSAEHDLIERMAAAIACTATDVPIEETLNDIGLSLSVREMVEDDLTPSDHKQKGPPNASDLLQRREDGFISALSVAIVPGEFREGRRVAVIANPFAYVRHVASQRIAIIAPVRYETDFASIPRFARWLIAPFGRHAEAAVIHDWLYAIGNADARMTRRLADWVFREALRDLGVNRLLRNIMFAAVRIGGGNAFGAADELRFRRLSDLQLIAPPPDPARYVQTVAIRSAL